MAQLSVGDEVYVTLGAGTNGVEYEIYSHPFHRYSTFSGFLVWSGSAEKNDLYAQQQISHLLNL